MLLLFCLLYCSCFMCNVDEFMCLALPCFHNSPSIFLHFFLRYSLVQYFFDTLLSELDEWSMFLWFIQPFLINVEQTLTDNKHGTWGGDKVPPHCPLGCNDLLCPSTHRMAFNSDWGQEVRSQGFWASLSQIEVFVLQATYLQPLEGLLVCSCVCSHVLSWRNSKSFVFPWH